MIKNKSLTHQKCADKGSGGLGEGHKAEVQPNVTMQVLGVEGSSHVEIVIH